MAHVDPGFFLAPFIGVIVDRFDRQRLMVTADIARAVVYMLLPLVRTVPGLILASFVLEVFTMLWSPAKEATVPAVVPPGYLATANSLSLVAAYATMPVAGPVQYALKALNDRLVQVSWLGFLGLNRALGDTQTLALLLDRALVRGLGHDPEPMGCSGVCPRTWRRPSPPLPRWAPRRCPPPHRWPRPPSHRNLRRRCHRS